MAHATRREWLRRLTLGGVLALGAPPLGAILEACAGFSGAPANVGGTVSFALSSEPAVLNPPIHTLAVESTVMSAIFAGLVRTRADGTFEPDLAESYQVQDGGMTYRFRLRAGLMWQDGRPLTSRDLLFTYQTYVDPRTQTAYLEGWDKIDRVETPDPTTVVYRMKAEHRPGVAPVAGAGPLRRDQAALLVEPERRRGHAAAARDLRDRDQGGHQAGIRARHDGKQTGVGGDHRGGRLLARRRGRASPVRRSRVPRRQA